MEPQGTGAAAGGAGALRVGDAIGYGWRAFKANPGPLVIVALVVLVLSGLVSGAGNVVSDNSVGLGIAFQVAGWLVSILLSLGMIRIALKVTRGEAADVADLFKGDQFGPYLGASIVFGLLVAVGLVLCIVPGIIVAVIFGFFGYVLLERGASVGEGFSGSSDITKGQRGTVFLLGLTLIGLNILGAIACGLGLLVTYPISIVAGGYAYRVLSGQPVAPVPE